VYELLLGEIPLAEAATQSSASENLWCVPATIDLAGAEIELVSLVARETRLKKAVSAYVEERAAAGEPVDYVFIDCPPSLGLLTVNALAAADSILIPLQCEYFALEGISELSATLQRVKRALNPALEIEGVILTMVDERTNLTQQVIGEVRSHFRDQVFKTQVPRSVRLAEAPSFGKPVLLYDIRSKGAEAYLELAQELMSHGQLALFAR